MVGPVNIPSPSPTPAPSPTTTSTTTTDPFPIELEPKFDAVLKIRENDGGGGLIQMEFGRDMVKADWDDLRRFQGKRNISFSENSIQYGSVYEGKTVAAQLEKILRRRNMSRIQIIVETPGKPIEVLSTLL